MKKEAAVIVFTKTPELSQVKTRLAKEIGRKQTDDFYKLSLKSTEMALEQAQEQYPKFDIIWSVHETQALQHPFWAGKRKVVQPHGSLGEKLAFTHQRFLDRYQTVVFIGGDCPHIEPNEIIRALEICQKRPKRIVFGPTLDGGFYLFATNSLFATQAWTNVIYSHHTTLNQLMGQISTDIDMEFLERNFDIDHLADLERFKNFLANQHEVPQRLQALEKWLETLNNRREKPLAL